MWNKFDNEPESAPHGRFKLHVASRYLFHASAHHLRYPSWTSSATPPSASRFRLYRRARLYVDELAMTRRIKTGGHTPVRHRHQQGQASFHVILVGGYVCDEWNACLRLPQQLARTSLLPTPNDKLFLIFDLACLVLHRRWNRPHQQCNHWQSRSE